MAKKSPVDPRALALSALLEAMTDGQPRVLFGAGKTPGFFKGSTEPVRQAAELAVREGWLVETNELAGKGAKAKRLYRVSPAGAQTAQEQSEPLVALRLLSKTIESRLAEAPRLLEAVDKVGAEANALSSALTQSRQQVESAIARVRAAGSAPPASTASEPTRTAKDDSAWLNDLPALVPPRGVEPRQTLGGVFDKLHERHPQLSLGAFQDAIRRLYEQGRIRLQPYTRALTEIGGQRAVIFLDGEVMWYVSAP